MDFQKNKKFENLKKKKNYYNTKEVTKLSEQGEHLTWNFETIDLFVTG